MIGPRQLEIGALYCPVCGKKLVREETHGGYNIFTGKPETWIEWWCPDRHSWTSTVDVPSGEIK